MVVWILPKLSTRLRTTGMPIRQMQQFADLYHQKPEAIATLTAISLGGTVQIEFYKQKEQVILI
ncbi:hypothetical protein [Nostoc sp. MG11]|uniref:hypothetical protein n=1 Tax=Nostoc sp. MG11 TaxID=2721166 RepID=UPI00186621D5|nr:hypothetical protein [Nostoc sp. MG11]